MKLAVKPCRGALLPAAATLHALALTSLFPIVVAEKTYTSSCQVDLVGTLGLLNETECIFLDSTFTHTYNSYVSNPYASEGTKEVLDAVVSSQTYIEDEATAGTSRGRRKLPRTRKVMETLSTCTTNVCEDPEAGLMDDAMRRRLRTGRRLGTFEDELCQALQHSGFDAFQTLTSCEVSCGSLEPLSVGQWIKIWYTNLKVNAQQILNGQQEEPAATTAAAAVALTKEEPAATPEEEKTILDAAEEEKTKLAAAEEEKTILAAAEEEKTVLAAAEVKTTTATTTTAAATAATAATAAPARKDRSRRRAAVELSYRFEGLDDFGCRFSQTPELGGPDDYYARETDNKYFREVSKITEEKCQELCLTDDGCCGYAYYSSWSDRCELWKATAGIGWLKPQEGFKCMRKVPNEPPPTPTTTVTAAAAVEPARYYYHGEANHACRCDPVDPTKCGPKDPETSSTDNKYYAILEGLANLQACQDECTSRSDCIGVEWHEHWKRCELWKDSNEMGIGWMTPLDGFQCYRKTATKSNLVFQFLTAWPDDDDIDNENYTKENRYFYGEHWCKSASSNEHAADFDGFAWGKTCGGFRYRELGYASHVAGRPVETVDDLPNEQKAEVQTFTYDVSKFISITGKKYSWGGFFYE